MDTERLLSVHDNEALKELIGKLSSELGKEKADSIIRESAKSILNKRTSDVSDRVYLMLMGLNDYICLEANIKGTGFDECFTPEQASVMIAEETFNVFYGDAELMVDLGMKEEVKGYLHSIAESIRTYADDKDILITKMAGDFPRRYADILEKSSDSEEPLAGFGKK